MELRETVGVVEAADRLGVRPRRIYELIDAGTLPGYLIDRQLRVRPPDLDDLLRRGEGAEPGPSPISE